MVPILLTDCRINQVYRIYRKKTLLGFLLVPLCERQPFLRALEKT